MMQIRLALFLTLFQYGFRPVLSIVEILEKANELKLLPNDLTGATPCTPRIGNILQNGFCDSLESCIFNKGMVSGTCIGRGICCMISRTCKGVISTRSGYFVSPDYPTLQATSDCVMKIRPYNDKMCQVRLQFLDFNIAQPDATGHCITDSLEISGSDPNYDIPVICGLNNGQHMHLTFAEGEISLKMKTTDSKWLISATQIPCSAPVANLAPAGCLQYFPAAGSSILMPLSFIRSFNFGRANLANQNYDICLSRTLSSCTFVWTTENQLTGSQFSVTDPLLIGNHNSACEDDDYVRVIGGTVTNPVPSPTPTTIRDLHCGSVNPTQIFSITTTSSYRMSVFFNDAAVGTGFQFGFTRNCF